MTFSRFIRKSAVLTVLGVFSAISLLAQTDPIDPHLLNSLHSPYRANSLKLYTRLGSDPASMMPQRSESRIPGLRSYGISIAWRRDLNPVRFREYEIGYYRPKLEDAQDENWEIFIRYQTLLFKPLARKRWFKYYFSIGPRLFYAREKTNESGAFGYPAQHTYYGGELPVFLGFDLYFSSRLSLTLTATPINTAYYWDKGQRDNPNLTVRQNEFLYSNLIMDFFNEWRIGLGYSL
ncbi:hypothetical protein [Flavilitoribacter nigricans]|uniref:DUF3575 domain-containing protein n=1 Tax=Flavilitoribacter nigricans (strain ATCC 23147 / DSM 23189 / NBRC 102662 / NCIMB 1420 / SS-2) TaxID=1122177 RepID=A0A2D0MYN7_FLAN2|nr:hypothetical protein [Flavilitoribacter nigricans]PHN01384.1 hypothetical protein CRP01_37605 [Flavilitoribacter nigricans DSM 23189 = NBRC 102662]